MNAGSFPASLGTVWSGGGRFFAGSGGFLNFSSTFGTFGGDGSDSLSFRAHRETDADLTC